MPRIVKSNAVLYAEQIEDVIEAPGPGGGDVVIARPGMWATYKDSDEGFDFVGFLTDAQFHEKFRKLA